MLHEHSCEHSQRVFSISLSEQHLLAKETGGQGCLDEMSAVVFLCHPCCSLSAGSAQLNSRVESDSSVLLRSALRHTCVVTLVVGYWRKPTL